MITQQGAINLTALIVPDLYVQIAPPANYLLNGVPTNVAGIVGTATWGPVNSPTVIGDARAYAAQFGQLKARKYDMGTAVALAVLQGAGNFRCVRVTDGTDAAASAIVQTSCLTLTARYTGSTGNSLQANIGPGSAAGSFKLSLVLPGYIPEVFDNIVGSGNALWVAMAAAVNSGTNSLRGPSQFVIASAGAGSAVPTTTAYAFTGGTDGATTITSAVLVGSDTTPRSGMYALRGTGASVAMLADADDSTQWSVQAAFGLAEGIYMIGTGPAGDTIANAVTTKATAGIDSYAFKLMFGDWLIWQDTVNSVTRTVSPQGAYLGLLANLSPQNSGLNKQIFGIAGTQKTLANQVYSSAELQALGGASIDLITNPAPGGAYFAPRFGRNTSSNATIHGDNYTRMTNYIASTLNTGMGGYVGTLQSPDQQKQAKATLDAFFTAMTGTVPPMIDGFSTQLDAGNNPPNRVALGYEQADVKVRYLSVVEYLVANVEGGQSVQINRISTQPAN
jgi:hypothetical protein